MEPISYLQAIILGALQGIAEPFPISSLGHAVILPSLLGWNIHQNDDFFLSFLVATHCATALVLFLFFLEDWKRIFHGFVRSLRGQATPRDADARLAWVIVIGTIPAGILGLLLQDKLQSVFASARSAAFFLILNGIMLFGAEMLRRRAPELPETEEDGDHRIAHTAGWRHAVGVGASQAIALIPGFSRSGATMGGGLLVGFSNEDAARFAFLLATPIIGAAALLKIPVLLGPDGDGVRGPALVASLCSAATAYVSVRFLMRYFETNRLTPFAVFCFIEGIVLSIWFTVS